MTSVLSSCFSDLKYSIRQDYMVTPLVDNDDNSDLGTSYIETTTYVYLYLDGAFYYRLNLTVPYWETVLVNEPVAKLQLGANDGTTADTVDHGLAFFLIVGFIFGVVVILHHIKILNFDERLSYRWLFNPHTNIDHNNEIQYHDARFQNWVEDGSTLTNENVCAQMISNGGGDKICEPTHKNTPDNWKMHSNGLASENLMRSVGGELSVNNGMEVELEMTHVISEMS